MRAFFINSPRKYKLGAVPRPEPAEDEVLIQVKRMGLCGTDLKIYEGKNPLVSYPRIIGHEVGATIVEVGDRVARDLREGMNVAVYPGTHCGECSACQVGRYNCCRKNEIYGVQRNGALTEYLAVPEEKVYPSDSLSLEELALIEPLAVGMHAVSRSDVTAGESMAVFGTGMIGLSVIAGAADRGAEVIGIDIDDEKLEVAEEAGANHVINSRTEDLHMRLSDITDGEGPRITLEAIGLAETFRTAVEEVAFAGRVIYLGWVSGDVTYDTSPFIKKELDIRGSRNSMPEDFRNSIDLLERGKFPVERVIGSVVTLDETGEAIEAWSADPASVYKIQVSMD